MHRIIALLTILCIGLPSSGLAKTVLTEESESMSFQVDEMVSGQGITWGLVFLSANQHGPRGGDDKDRPVKEERLLLALDECIRDVVESPEGWLYVATDSGRILRIRPAFE